MKHFPIMIKNYNLDNCKLFFTSLPNSDTFIESYNKRGGCMTLSIPFYFNISNVVKITNQMYPQ